MRKAAQDQLLGDKPSIYSPVLCPACPSMCCFSTRLACLSTAATLALPPAHAPSRAMQLAALLSLAALPFLAAAVPWFCPRAPESCMSSAACALPRAPRRRSSPQTSAAASVVVSHRTRRREARH